MSGDPDTVASPARATWLARASLRLLGMKRVVPVVIVVAVALIGVITWQIRAQQAELDGPATGSGVIEAEGLDLSARLGAGLSRAASRKRIAFARTASRLRPEPLAADAKRARTALVDTARRARPAVSRLLDQRRQQLASQAKLLETLSYQATLDRGYAIVRDPQGKVLRSAQQVSASSTVDLMLSDGTVELSPTGASKPASAAKPKPRKPKTSSSDQGSLF